MNIMQIKEYLEEYINANGDCIVANGWIEADSYRGYYDQLAVQPCTTAKTINQLIKVLVDSVGCTFTGYKGGEYTMYWDTDVYYANYGETGPSITKAFLKNYIIDNNSVLEDWNDD